MKLKIGKNVLDLNEGDMIFCGGDVIVKENTKQYVRKYEL